MRKIKIAQIGMNQNSHGTQIFQTLCQHPEVFEIAGYALVEDERENCAERLYVFDGYPELTLDEILNDPTIEAVTVETDEIHLTKYATLAAQHGKHIHMEKPGSQSLADFEALIEAVRASGKVFHTGYMYRYNPYVREILEKVRTGALGEIYSIEAQMDCIQKPEKRQWMSTFKGGIMFHLGCHLIDLILQIQGAPSNIIPLNRSTGIDGVSAEDFGMAILEYKNGVSFAKSCCAEFGGYMRRQLVVTGSLGTVELKPFEYSNEGDKESHVRTDKFEYDSNAWGWNTRPDVERSESFNRYGEMLLSFGEMVRGEKQNPYTCDYELALFKTVLACCGVETPD